MSPLNVKGRLYRLWELLVIYFVLMTGKGKRRREWIHYRRSMGARQAAVTRKRNKAARVGQPLDRYLDHEGDATPMVP